MKVILALLALLPLTACAGMESRFAPVNAAAHEAFETEHIDGMGLAIYDRNGVKLFEQMYGDFEPNRRVPIASASKLVSGLTIFRLIDQGKLSLDSTTGQVLGWSGDSGNITLRQLLSFTSGLKPENFCTYRALFTLAGCVDAIAREGLAAPPGTRFDYGSTHLAVAGRMAEIVTGKPWNSIFAEQILSPLGLPSDIAYYSNPLRPVSTSNTLLAGGLIMSMNEYERVLHFVFDKGRWQGHTLMAPEIFDAQARAPYPQAEIGKSPWPGHRYGLTGWLDCEHPDSGCADVSSPGAFGFTPWIDRQHGYYAILGMDYRRNMRDSFGGRTAEKLKPLIVQALETLQ